MPFITLQEVSVSTKTYVYKLEYGNCLICIEIHSGTQHLGGNSFFIARE